MRGMLNVGAVVVAASSLAGSAAASPPVVQAGQAHAQKVLAQVNALDVHFGRVVDAWDGARIRLVVSERDLVANKVALGRARRQRRIADQRLARVVVAIYENGEPTLPQILVGATSISDLVDRLEAFKTIDAYDRQLANHAARAQTWLTKTRMRLRETERMRRATLTGLSVERGQIGTMLARRRRLLASIRSQVAVLQRREAAQQHALAVAARTRLAREQTRLAQQAAGRAAAARTAAERAATATTTTQSTAPQTDPISTTPAPTTDTATPTTTSTPIPVPTPVLGAGHPQAATIALRYLGVPYQWGGASPTGFDCSGLVMYVYAQLGIQLPHYAAAQYTYGVPVPRDQLQPGDLVFYDGLSHVGIYIGNGDIVHAPHTGDVVKISPLAQGGLTYDGARRI